MVLLATRMGYACFGAHSLSLGPLVSVAANGDVPCFLLALYYNVTEGCMQPLEVERRVVSGSVLQHQHLDDVGDPFSFQAAAEFKPIIDKVHDELVKR